MAADVQPPDPGRGSAGLGPLLVTAVVCVWKVMVLMGLGVCLIRCKLIDEAGIKTINKLSFAVLVPSLLFSRVVESASLEAWRVCWLLPASAAVHILTAFSAASLAARALRLHGDRERVFVLSSSFGNSNALPVLIIATVAADFVPEDRGAAQRGVGYLAYYLVFWSVACWSAGYAFIASPGRPGPLPRAGTRHRAGAGPKFLEIVPTADEGDVPPVPLSGGDQGRPAEDARELQAVPPSTEAPLGKPAGPEQPATAGAAEAGGRWARTRAILGKAINPPVVAILLGVVLGMSPAKGVIVGGPLKSLHELTLMMGDASIPIATLASGASLAVGSGASPAALAANMRRAEFPGVLLMRAVLLPLLGFLLVKAADAAGVLSGPGGVPVDPMLRFVILVQAAMPSANNTVMMTAMARSLEASQLAAALMAVQMLLLPLTLTVWITLFLDTSYAH